MFYVREAIGFNQSSGLCLSVLSSVEGGYYDTWLVLAGRDFKLVAPLLY